MNTDNKLRRTSSRPHFSGPDCLAKRLECAASRRFHFDPPRHPRTTQRHSAGMRRTPDASRHWQAHKAALCSYAILTSLLFFLLDAAPPLSAATILLTGATVHTISGETFSPGQVLIKDGKIAAVGKTVPSNGAETVDLTGKHLYPGMIALNTVLGLTEISGVRATQDTTEVGDYTPDVESWISVNPDSELIPVTRANGIAYFEPVPQGGIVSGQSGLVAVDGWTTEQRTIRKSLALHLFWPGMELDTTPKERARANPKFKSVEEQAKERRARLRATDDFFEEAKAYAKARDAATKGKASLPDRIPAWEAMLPYVAVELPIMVHADEIRQINAAVNWAI